MAAWRTIALAGLVCAPTTLSVGATPPPNSPEAKQEAERLDRLPAVAPVGKSHVDSSGRKEKGHASYYANRFANRKPITVPQPQGGVKLGAGAAEASPQEVQDATTATKELFEATAATHSVNETAAAR